MGKVYHIINFDSYERIRVNCGFFVVADLHILQKCYVEITAIHL